MSLLPKKKAARWKQRIDEILDERDDEIVRLYRGGLSIWSVATLLSVSQQTVRMALIKANEKPRRWGGKRTKKAVKKAKRG